MMAVTYDRYERYTEMTFDQIDAYEELCHTECKYTGWYGNTGLILIEKAREFMPDIPDADENWYKFAGRVEKIKENTKSTVEIVSLGDKVVMHHKKYVDKDIADEVTMYYYPYGATPGMISYVFEEKHGEFSAKVILHK